MKTNAMRILDTLGIRYELVYVEEEMRLFDVVAVSAGVLGAPDASVPDDYLRATKASVGPISRTG